MIPKYKKITSLLILPLNFGFFLLTLIGLIIVSFWGLEETKLGLNVFYQDNGLLVVGNSGDLKNLLILEGDIIVGFNQIPLEAFLTQGGKLYLSNVPPAPPQLYHWPLPTGTKMLLGSTNATFLTVKRAGTSQLQVLNLTTDDFLKTKKLADLVQIVIGWFFWFSSAVLVVMRPRQLMTLAFSLYFAGSGVYFALSPLIYYYRGDIILIVMTVFCLVLPPLGMVYFATAFPYGKPVRKKGQRFFLNLVLAYVILNLLGLLISLFGGSGILADYIQLNAFRLFLFTILIGYGYFKIFWRFFRTKGEEYLRLKLVCFTLFAVVPPPFILFTFSSLDFHPEIINVYLVFLWLPTILIPIAFLYGILKQQLFYPDLVVRNLLTYSLLLILLTTAYWLITALFSLFLPTLLHLGSIEAGFVAFLIIAFGFARLQSWTRTLLDRLFYRERLDYTGLVNRWTTQLAFASLNLTELAVLATRQLAQDFKYKQVGLFLVEKPSKLAENYLSINLTQTAVMTETETVRGLFIDPISAEQDHKVELNSSSLFSGLVDGAILERQGLSVKTMLLDPVILTLSGVSDQLLALFKHSTDVYQFFIPFSPECGVGGGLYFGEKFSEQAPSSQERAVLTSLIRQMALALDRVVKLQLEQTRRQLVQTLVLEQDNLTERQKQNLAGEVHDTVVQDIIAVKTKLARLIQTLNGSGSDQLTECYHLSQEAEQHLREIIGQLRPKAFEFGLVVAIKELLLDFMVRYEEMTFQFYSALSEEEEDMLSNFGEESLRHLYRTVQEAVTNAAKHSGGTVITVKITLSQPEFKNASLNMETSPTDLLIEISDDGNGFGANYLSLDQLLAQGHYGLFFMQERTNLVGGQLSFGSTQARGSLIQIKVPVKMVTTDTVPATSEKSPFFSFN